MVVDQGVDLVEPDPGFLVLVRPREVAFRARQSAESPQDVRGQPVMSTVERRMCAGQSAKPTLVNGCHLCGTRFASTSGPRGDGPSLEK